MSIAQTIQSIFQQKEQVSQVKQQVEQFNPQIQQSRQQLSRATPTSQTQIRSMEQQRAISKEAALQDLYGTEQQLKQAEQDVQSYASSPAGIIQYAKESGIAPKVEYRSIGYIQNGKIVRDTAPVYIYDTPYGKVEDTGQFNQMKANVQFNQDVQAYGKSGDITKLMAKYNLNTEQAVQAVSNVKQQQEFNQYLTNLKQQGINPITETKNGTTSIIGYEDTNTGMSYSVASLMNAKTPTQQSVYINPLEQIGQSRMSTLQSPAIPTMGLKDTIKGLASLIPSVRETVPSLKYQDPYQQYTTQMSSIKNLYSLGYTPVKVAETLANAQITVQSPNLFVPQSVTHGGEYIMPGTKVVTSPVGVLRDIGGLAESSVKQVSKGVNALANLIPAPDSTKTLIPQRATYNPYQEVGQVYFKPENNPRDPFLLNMATSLVLAPVELGANVLTGTSKALDINLPKEQRFGGALTAASSAGLLLLPAAIKKLSPSYIVEERIAKISGKDLQVLQNLEPTRVARQGDVIISEWDNIVARGRKASFGREVTVTKKGVIDNLLNRPGKVLSRKDSIEALKDLGFSNNQAKKYLQRKSLEEINQEFVGSARLVTSSNSEPFVTFKGKLIEKPKLVEGYKSSQASQTNFLGEGTLSSSSELGLFKGTQSSTKFFLKNDIPYSKLSQRGKSTDLSEVYSASKEIKSGSVAIKGKEFDIVKPYTDYQEVSIFKSLSPTKRKFDVSFSKVRQVETGTTPVEATFAKPFEAKSIIIKEKLNPKKVKFTDKQAKEIKDTLTKIYGKLDKNPKPEIIKVTSTPAQKLVPSIKSKVLEPTSLISRPTESIYQGSRYGLLYSIKDIQMEYPKRTRYNPQAFQETYSPTSSDNLSNIPKEKVYSPTTEAQAVERAVANFENSLSININSNASKNFDKQSDKLGNSELNKSYPIGKNYQGQLSRQDSLSKQVQQPKQVTLQPPVNIQRPNTPPPDITKTRNKLPRIFIPNDNEPLSIKKPIKVKKTQLLTVELRRKGKFTPIAKVKGDISKALQIGKIAARRSIGASIRIKGEQGYLNLNPTQEFRKSKSNKDPFSLIQRKSARLNTPQERLAILESRRRR